MKSSNLLIFSNNHLFNNTHTNTPHNHKYNQHPFLLIITFIFLISIISPKLLRQNIPVSYSLDDNYKYPTLVSITSILENSSPSSFYTFYLLVDKKSFTESSKNLFYHLEDKYDKCKMTIIEMDETLLTKARVDRYPLPTYYRLALGELLPEVNRIIYLDGDTLIFKDLTEMINLRMNNNVVLGFVDDGYRKAEPFGIKTFKYVTGGVLLMNLRKIRRENITKKFFDFISYFGGRLIQEDQTVLNIVLHGRIDFLPPQFGCWDFLDEKAAKYHNSYQNNKNNIKAYDEKELINAWKNPTIVHYVRGKPWNKRHFMGNVVFHEKWWEYAKKTDEYKNILKFYGGKK